MSGRRGLKVASLVLGGWSPVRTGDARMGTLACETDVLKGAYIFGALSVVKVTTYWSSGCSAIASCHKRASEGSCLGSGS